jgi:polysaccharide chain length determinant protein (PEP-CTERM system associated)
MLGHRAMTVDDYLGILRRRWPLLLLPTLLLPILAYAVSLVIPAKYTSETLVLVEQPKVPQQLIPSVITEQLNQRLSTITQQVLSRTRLQPIIERFGLYKDEMGKVPIEDLVARMRSQISVSIVRTAAPSRASNEIPGFTITFTAENPRVAQQVCNEILSMFIDENLKRRGDLSQTTTDFLSKQVEDAKRRLDERDQRLAEFKRRYLGQLPGQEQANMQLLMNATAQLEAATAALNRAQQDRAYTQSQLDQAIAAWKSSQSGSNPQTLDQQLQQAQQMLDDLESKYTSNHPDVVKQKAVIEQLKRKIAEANSGAAPAPAATTAAQTIEPPNVQQLRNVIHQLDITIKEKARDQERLQDVIKTYRSRVEISPLVEQQFNELNREYAMAQQFYDDMLKKRATSEVATRLERDQQSETFRVMDPPNAPGKPSSPDRLLFAAGGLGGGFCLGLLLAVLLEFRDKSLRNERDIEAILQLPTLAMIPTVNPAASGGKGLLSQIRKEAA